MTKSDALQAILAAISKGVPLYNSGDHLGCLKTYVKVAKRLVASPDALPHGCWSLLASVTSPDALAAAAHGSPTERAWAMRRALDQVLLLLRGGATANSGASDSDREEVWLPSDSDPEKTADPDPEPDPNPSPSPSPSPDPNPKPKP